MQLECRVLNGFVDELGIKVRYDRYIATAVIDGTINFTRFHLMRYIRFVHFQNLARIRIYLIFYTR